MNSHRVDTPAGQQHFLVAVAGDAPSAFLLKSLDGVVRKGFTLTLLTADGSTTQEHWYRHVRLEGLAEGRSAGIKAVYDYISTGDFPSQTYVTIVPSEAEFSPDYFEQIRAAITRFPTEALLAARLKFRATDSERTHTEPRTDHLYLPDSCQVVNLLDQPEDLPRSIGAVVISASRLPQSLAALPSELDSGFLDQAVLLNVLADSEAYSCVYVDATLTLRTPSEDPILARRAFRDVRKFTDPLRSGMLPYLRHYADHPEIALLVQHSILADLGLYFEGDERLTGQMNAEMHHVQEEFHELVEQILALIPNEVLDSTDHVRVPQDRYVAWRHGYTNDDWHDGSIALTGWDKRKGLVQASYYFTGKQPLEQVRRNTTSIEPYLAKTRDIVYAGRVLAHERILWLTSRASISIELNGSPVKIAAARTSRPRSTWYPGSFVNRFEPRRNRSTDARRPSTFRKVVNPNTWYRILIKGLATVRPVRRRYNQSWILMDRVERGHDNAEHLFKHLQRHEPQINAWFAVEKNSTDWKRLRAQGHKKLLAYGSFRWKLACLNATHVISSQAGPYVYNPMQLRRFGRRTWRFIFLQHGVIATDLHRWLNQRKFDLFITSTHDEFASIAGTNSQYRMTPHEVVLTGLPRHDRLRKLASVDKAGKQNLILCIPSWREYLLGPKDSRTGARELNNDFEKTHFARAWLGLLESHRLLKLAESHDATIAFMPHPNMQPYLHRLSVPQHVKLLSYDSSDIQENLAEARVVVTDFSSVVFDAAYIRRPIVYYQFDQAEAFSGAHTVRQGYFSYEEDGFGPVAYTEQEALDALEAIMLNGHPPMYIERMNRTFPHSDDNCSARVIQAIRELEQPLSIEAASRTIELPVAPPNRPTPTAG